MKDLLLCVFSKGEALVENSVTKKYCKETYLNYGSLQTKVFL